MGVKGLWKLLEECHTADTPRNQRLAIDASIWLYKYKNVPQTNMIYSFVKRIIMLLYHKNSLFFVFDSKAPAEKIKTIAKRNEIRLRNELKAHFDKIANNRMCTACNVLYKTCEHGREVNMEEIKEIEDVVSYKLRNHDYNWGDDVSDIDDDTEISECNLTYGYNKGWSRTNTNCDELVNEEKEEFLPKNFDGLSQVKKLKVLDELREANAFQSCGFKEMNGKAFSEYQLKKIGRSYAITSLINEVSDTKNKRIMGDCRSYYELNYENDVPKRIKKEDKEAFDIFTLEKEVKQVESNKDSANNEIIDENRFVAEINSIFMENEGSVSVSNQNDASNNMDWDSKELLYQSNKRDSMAKNEIKTAQEVKNFSFQNIAEVARSITKEPEESKNVYLSVDKNSVFYKNECYGQSENRMEENNEGMMNQQVEIKANMRGAINFIAESKIKNSENNEKHVESLAVTNDELMTALEKNNEHDVVDPIQKMDKEMEERVRDRMASLERNIRTRSINLMNELQCITVLMKKMLTILGIPYIDAPYESDSQLGYLNNECELERNERKSVFNPEEKCEHLDTNQVFNDKIYNLKVDAIITEDNDVFLFGANRVYKDYFKCPKLYTMQNIRDKLNLNREDLIKLSVFLGNDYTVGFRGIGPKKALEILKDEDKANYDRKVFDSEYSKVKNVYYKSIVDKKPLKLRSSRKLSEIRKFLSDNFLNDNQINEIVFYLRKINAQK
ncbi:5'-3' exonuclease [Trachipleistophora hominis]|uniref:5'-3' exonuclease n=1 Tax=Trachipleistophora hominis TaxID=72359 RepID=L7JUE5_TRAHO|nr:5'-3' exonuclease [Trachipleistophora hominis]